MTVQLPHGSTQTLLYVCTGANIWCVVNAVICSTCNCIWYQLHTAQSLNLHMLRWPFFTRNFFPCNTLTVQTVQYSAMHSAILLAMCSHTRRREAFVIHLHTQSAIRLTIGYAVLCLITTFCTLSMHYVCYMCMGLVVSSPCALVHSCWWQSVPLPP